MLLYISPPSPHLRCVRVVVHCAAHCNYELRVRPRIRPWVAAVAVVLVCEAVAVGKAVGKALVCAAATYTATPSDETREGRKGADGMAPFDAAITAIPLLTARLVKPLEACLSILLGYGSRWWAALELDEFMDRLGECRATLNALRGLQTLCGVRLQGKPGDANLLRYQSATEAGIDAAEEIINNAEKARKT